MTHAQWHARLRQCLAMVDRQPTRAVKRLEALLGRLEAAAATSVGEWHVDQTLEALSIVQSQLEHHHESAAAMERVAERQRQQSVYSQRAFVAACATAAIELVTAGDRASARRVLRQAEKIAAQLRPREALFEAARKVVRRRSAR
jgi:hypothetical protein